MNIPASSLCLHCYKLCTLCWKNESLFCVEIQQQVNLKQSFRSVQSCTSQLKTKVIVCGLVSACLCLLEHIFYTLYLSFRRQAWVWQKRGARRRRAPCWSTGCPAGSDHTDQVVPLVAGNWSQGPAWTHKQRVYLLRHDSKKVNGDKFIHYFLRS